MQIATGWSIASAAEPAVKQAYDRMMCELDARPSYILLAASVDYTPEPIMKTLRLLAPDIPIQAGSSCLGVMSARGFHRGVNGGLGLLGISDPEGAYGVGSAELGEDPRAAGAAAIAQALEAAAPQGAVAEEAPALIWIGGAPGAEELVLLGIADVVGPDVPIVGGSTADNTVSGVWWQSAGAKLHRDAVVVTAMYPSVDTYIGFEGVDYTTRHTGAITRAEGRTIYEIDGRPAAEVYNTWTNGAIAGAMEMGGNVLSLTSLSPLARVVGSSQRRMRLHYRLSHPALVTRDGAMTLFTDVEPGDKVILMSDSRWGLIPRAGRVAQRTIEASRIQPWDISGALVVYCAGCMLEIQDRMDDVARQLSRTMPGVPFLGIFTFGEQGYFQNQGNYHGNLMVSMVAFGRDPGDVDGLASRTEPTAPSRSP